LHFVCSKVRKIPYLSGSVGRSMCIFKSNLPERKMAESTRSMRFVAATMMILSVGENPSISLRNWLMVVVVS
jgi:hypothetical protein